MSLKLRFYTVLVIALAVIVLAMTLPGDSRQAQAARPAPAEQPDGWGDEGISEVGVEWINDFPGTDGDRSHWDESCDGLYYGLTNIGWTGNFRWTDWNAWKSDFVNESDGGEEDTWVDSVDIAMLCTHGSGTWDPFWGQNLSSVYFGSSMPDQHLRPGDAYNGYGDKDLEYLAFDSCSVLSEGGPAPYYNRGYWATTMNGLHLLLGFNNTMYVWAPGDGAYWSLFMQGFGWWLPAYNVTQAWFQAVDYNQPTVTCARVLAETADNYNNYLHGYGYVGADPAQDSTYWYWDHCSSGAKAVESQFDSGLDLSTLVSVPVFKVEQRVVDEGYIRQRIAPAFFSDVYTGTIGEDSLFFYLADYTQGMTTTVQIAKASGGFNFRRLDQLWVTPVVPPQLPNEEEAYMQMEEWFKMSGEGLPGVWYRDMHDFTIESLIEDTRLMPGQIESAVKPELETIPADAYLTYDRVVSGLARTTLGDVMADYQVVGPGSQLKTYLGDGSVLIGVQGGTRDVTYTPEEVVELLDVETAWKMFLENQNIAIPNIPYDADEIIYTAVDFGYYELPLTQFQGELIPVYIFLADFLVGGEPIAQGVVVYVPAALEYMPPTVEILAPVSGERFSPGQPISFNGLVSGGTPPYTFQWQSDHDGFLGEGESILASLSSFPKEGQLSKHVITLQVTDANGMQSAAMVDVYINGLTLLPLVVK
jgi:hypothetical protein